MKVYLAGSVPKGDKEAADYRDWRREYSVEINKVLKNIELFDPNIFYKLEGDSKAVTGADCMCIKKSDVVIVNAEEKLGAGTAMELVVAKYFSKLVISVLPKDSYHRRSNLEFHGRTVADWIHPFVDTFSDYIIENIKDIGSIAKDINSKNIKSIKVIDEAIQYTERILDE